MKICDLTQFYSPVSGGVKRYLAEKVAYLRARADQGGKDNDDRHVLIVPGARTERTGDDRARVYTVASPVVSRTAQYRMLLNLHAVERILETERPDIIESNDPYQVAWKALASGRALGIPVVGFYHSHFAEAYVRTAMKFLGRAATEMMMEVTRRYVRALYERFARTFVPSAALGGVLRDWGVTNTVTVELGVDPEVFHPSADPADSARPELGVDPEATLLLYVGRLSAEKNVETLFESFDLLRRGDFGKAGQRCRLLVVGDGPGRRALKLLTRRHPDAVLWRPYCADARALARLYRAADLFVHPGVQETFGLVTLESQACGTPVVGIRGSYMDRIVFGGVLRHWAPENTPAALAAAIVGLAHRPRAEWRELEAALGAEVRRRYAWSGVFGRLFAAYREVMAEHHQRARAS